MSFPLAHWPDAHFPNAHWPHEHIAVLQGGGGGKKRKPFKSYDQRQAERLEQLRLDEEARNKAKYGDLPKGLAEALKPTPSPYKRLLPATVKAYANSRARDDEEAMNLILALL